MPEQRLQQGQYHQPVMAAAVVQYLATPQARLIVDATLGDGGHTLALLQAGNAKLKIVGLDVDPNSLAAAQQRLAAYQDRCSFSRGNFRQITGLLAARGSISLDGVFADLGLSSRQIDLPERGLSYLEEGPLDLRLNPFLAQNAAELLAALEQDELVRLLRDYGEERHARAIARAIIHKRRSRAIGTTAELRRIIEGVVRGPLQIKSVARVFQALRIAVNDELGALQDFLPQAFALLRPGGRLAVISYHSLEDRIVKQYFRERAKDCTCPPELPVCVCSKKSQAMVLTAKPVQPTPEEIKSNRRARSAKLRVLQKR